MLGNDSPKMLLNECESVIHKGMKSFYEIGKALITIRDHELYKDGGYETFEDYCDKKWEFSRRRAYQYIDSVKIQNILTGEKPSDTSEYNEDKTNEGLCTIVHKLDTEEPLVYIAKRLPKNESICRPMAKIEDVFTVSKVWKECEDIAEETGKPITASLVHTITNKYLYPDGIGGGYDPMENRIVTYLTPFYKKSFDTMKRGEHEADFLRRIVKAHIDHPELLAPYL